MLPRGAQVQRVRTVVLVVFLIITGLLVVIPENRVQVARVYNSLSFFLFPSAEKALIIGTKHFNAPESAWYDIERAEVYLRKAVVLDTDLPQLHHQLARVAFLKNDLPLAKEHIDYEISHNEQVDYASYYIRALILGFMGRYEEAEEDYKMYIAFRSTSWAAINDYAWILLKLGKNKEAGELLERGLIHHPGNPWLLNAKAATLYAIGLRGEAYESARAAYGGVEQVSAEAWLEAYPGNDPLIAIHGIEALRRSIEDNMHMIDEYRSQYELQSR